MSTQTIGVIGLGYVGLPLAIHFADQGAKVIGFDINDEHIESLKSGVSPFPDVQSSKLDRLLKSTHISFTNEAKDLSQCEVLVVCVPTPLTPEKKVDLSALENAARLVASHAKNEALIISESTSYPGTLREVFQSRLSGERANESFYLATAPERVDPGSNFEFRDIPRVVGGVDEASTLKVIDFYKRFFTQVHQVSSPEVAELSKLLENTFRQVNISLVNEINDLCRRVGIDTREVIEAASTKPYGFMKFSPSAGIGGHCIPVDPEYLQYFAGRSGAPLKLVSAASSVNDEMGESIAKRVEKYLGGRIPSSVLVLGIAYKPNVPDVRDTPAKAVIESLRARGVDVAWHDPLADTWLGETSVDLNNGEWDVGIVVTSHDVLEIDLARSRCGVIFDCTGNFTHIPEIVQI